MGNSIKKVKISLMIIILIIIFFVFTLKTYAADALYVDYNFIEYYEYTGNEIYINDLNINRGKTILTKDVDYTIEYENSDLITKGRKSVTITINADSDYVFLSDAKSITIDYYIVDKIIDLDNYNIKDDMSILLTDTTVTLDSYYQSLLDDYTGYFTINKSSATRSGDYTDIFTFDEAYDTVLAYSNFYNVKKYAYSKASSNFTLNWHVCETILTDESSIEVTGLENIAYKLDSVSEFSWNGDVLLNDTTLTTSDYDADLYSREFGLISNDYKISQLEQEYATGSVYDLDLVINFKGSYGGTIIKTIKLAPSIEDATFELLDGAEWERDISGDRLAFDYGLANPPFNLKLNIEGTLKTLVYDTDFTFDKEYLISNAGYEYSLEIKGIGNYAGSLDVKYRLIEKSITSSDITYEAKENAYYDGENANLEIAIYDKNISTESPIQDYNYSISYEYDLENNKGIATITGIVNYKDSFTVEFILASKRWGDSEFNCDIDWDDEYQYSSDNIGAMYYNPSGITPNITLTYGSDTLVFETDYDYEIEGNLTPGEISYLKITLKGIYYGSEMYPFTILYNIVEDDPLLSMSESHNSDYYIGQRQRVLGARSIEYNGITLSSDEYDLETVIKDKDGNIHYYSDGLSGISDADANGDTYTAYVKVTFKGIYRGEINYTFLVVPSIETTTIEILDDAIGEDNSYKYIYKGEKIVPSFNLLLDVNGDIRTLKYGEDFTCGDDFHIGPNKSSQKEFYIKGINNYGGGKYIYFSVEEKDISSNDIALTTDDNIYIPVSSDEYICNIKLHDNTIDYDLIKDIDYEVNYELGIDEVVIYISGINNFTGSINKTVLKANNLLSSEMINISYDKIDEANIMYFTGSDTKPTIEVKDNDTLLILDTDYSITYEGDYSYGSTINLTIKGLNNYYGEFKYEYLITATIFEDIESPYVGEKNISYILEKLELNDLFSEIDDAVISDVGNYNINATLKPGYVFYKNEEYSLTSTFKLTITKALLSNDYSIEIDEARYTSKEVKPNVKIIDLNGNVLTLDDDYTITYDNNINVGKGLITITGIGNYDGTIENLEFDIIGKSLEDEDIKITIENNCYIDEENSEYICDIKLHDETFDYDLIKDTDYEVGYEIVDNEVIFYLNGINKYSGAKEYNVRRALYKVLNSNIKITYDEDNIMYYSFNEVYPQVEVKYNDTLLTLDSDYVVTYDGEYVYGSTKSIKIKGINDYYFSYEASYVIKSNEIEKISLPFKGKTTISELILNSDYKNVFENYSDLEIIEVGEYKINAKTNAGYIIKNGDEYYLEGLLDVLIYPSDDELDEIISKAATDIISKATESADINLDAINFEDLTGLSKAELLEAKEYYNNLEQYVVDKNIDSIVNAHLKDLGFDIELTSLEVSVRLKEYLDTYALDSGYTSFNSQVDDVINALDVEETKEIIKEELLTYIHRHNISQTLLPIHKYGSSTINNNTDMDKLNDIITSGSSEIDNVKYEKCLDDENREELFSNTIEKIHEIKNVSISIIKHTQSQTIANNNIEAYYNELVESGKYNEAQLELLKEVFDEMSSEVEALLLDDNINTQEELDKIVKKAVEKLSGVPISNLKSQTDDGEDVLVSSSDGMPFNTELVINSAPMNVSIAISRAIGSNNITSGDVLLIKNKNVKEALDIDLYQDGVKQDEFNGTYTIKILLSDELKAFKNLQIIYIAGDGAIEIHDTYIEGDYLVFTTSHFSTYYILGDEIFEYSPINKILLSLIVALIIFIVYLILKIKNKKISELGFGISLILVPLSALIDINLLIMCFILSGIAAILIILLILLSIKYYKIERSLTNEE